MGSYNPPISPEERRKIIEDASKIEVSPERRKKAEELRKKNLASRVARGVTSGEIDPERTGF